MKLNESKLIILIASIILGYVFSSQLSYLKPAVIQIPTLQDYQQTMYEMTRSRDEIRVLNERKRLLNSKLLEYGSAGSLEKKVIEKLEEELKSADLYACLTDVQGPGIIMTLSDNTVKAAAAKTIEEIEMYNVHDMDIWEIVWALKNGGAEAVSVNDRRIGHDFSIYCAGPVVIINGIKLAPPFNIKAIGNPDMLVKALEGNETFMFLKDMDFPINLLKDNKVTILKNDSY